MSSCPVLSSLGVAGQAGLSRLTRPNFERSGRTLIQRSFRSEIDVTRLVLELNGVCSAPYGRIWRLRAYEDGSASQLYQWLRQYPCQSLCACLYSVPTAIAIVVFIFLRCGSYERMNFPKNDIFEWFEFTISWMMALRKDGSSKRSASYMPYDSSNVSFLHSMNRREMVCSSYF